MEYLHGCLSRRQFVRDVAWLGGSMVGLVALSGCARLPFQALLQPPAKIPHIGYFGALAPDYPAPVATPHFEVFRSALAQHDYVDGRNLVIESRFAGGRFERIPELLAELVSLPVELIVLSDTRSIVPAKEATGTIPIVMVLTSDPVGAGVAASLARPGGNMTGLTMAPVETMHKRLQLLKTAVPRMSRTAVLFNPADLLGERMSVELSPTAAGLGLELELLPVRQPEELDEAFDRARQRGADGVVVVGEPMINAHQQRVADLAIFTRLPAIGMTREFVVAGLFMSYAPSFSALFVRSAAYVAKILSGVVPADLPIERPPRYEFVINLKTAKTLGITVPQSVLETATEVIR